MDFMKRETCTANVETEGLRETFRERGCYDENHFFIGGVQPMAGYELARQAGSVKTRLEAVLSSDEVAEGVLEAFLMRGSGYPRMWAAGGDSQGYLH